MESKSKMDSRQNMVYGVLKSNRPRSTVHVTTKRRDPLYSVSFNRRRDFFSSHKINRISNTTWKKFLFFIRIREGITFLSFSLRTLKVSLDQVLRFWNRIRSPQNSGWHGPHDESLDVTPEGVPTFPVTSILGSSPHSLTSTRPHLTNSLGCGRDFVRRLGGGVWGV